MVTKLIAFLAIGLFIGSLNCSIGSDQVPVREQTIFSDSVINISSNLGKGFSYDFYYIDEYLNNIQSVLTLEKSTKIVSVNPVIVYEGLNPKYLFLPGDSIVFVGDDNDKIVAKSTNAKCNEFLAFQHQFSNKFPEIFPFDPKAKKIIDGGNLENVVIGLKDLLEKQLDYLKQSKLEDSYIKIFEKHLTVIHLYYLANAYYYCLMKGYPVEKLIRPVSIEKSLDSILDMKTGAYRSAYTMLYKINRKENPMVNFSEIVAKLSTDSFTKDYVRLNIIKTNSASFNESQKVLFVKLFQNDQYKQYFSEKYLASKFVLNSKTELITFKHSNRNLDSVLNALKGKVVYVDLWASWCLPCRREMGKSAELRKNIAMKEIQFVYLSFDEDFKSWKTASVDEDLDAHPLNFLVRGAFSSPFAQEFKIKEIPRYLIFDKEGVLVYDDAPSPSDTSIISKLKSLIK